MIFIYRYVEQLRTFHFLFKPTYVFKVIKNNGTYDSVFFCPLKVFKNIAMVLMLFIEYPVTMHIVLYVDFHLHQLFNAISDKENSIQVFVRRFAEFESLW